MANAENLSIKRMNKKCLKDNKIEYIPTGTSLFTFKGTIIPKEVRYCGMGMRTAIYISPVIQCFSCLRYGHTKKNCKDMERCFNCGQEKHMSEQKKGEDQTLYTCEAECQPARKRPFKRGIIKKNTINACIFQTLDRIRRTCVPYHNYPIAAMTKL